MRARHIRAVLCARESWGSPGCAVCSAVLRGRVCSPAVHDTWHGGIWHAHATRMADDGGMEGYAGPSALLSIALLAGCSPALLRPVRCVNGQWRPPRAEACALRAVSCVVRGSGSLVRLAACGGRLRPLAPWWWWRRAGGWRVRVWPPGVTAAPGVGVGPVGGGPGAVARRRRASANGKLICHISYIYVVGVGVWGRRPVWGFTGTRPRRLSLVAGVLVTWSTVHGRSTSTAAWAGAWTTDDGGGTVYGGGGGPRARGRIY